TMLYFLVFFFQAEDGIRDRNVTGVQTCALPICAVNKQANGFILTVNDQLIVAESLVVATGGLSIPTLGGSPFGYQLAEQFGHKRSEERRVGKEWRARWWG